MFWFLVRVLLGCKKIDRERRFWGVGIFILDFIDYGIFWGIILRFDWRYFKSFFI